MHRKYCNEKGYTLIYILLAISLIFIFTTALIRANVNSAGQIAKSHNDVQTTHLAEMGLEFFNETLKLTIAQPLTGDTIQEARNSLEGRLNYNLAEMGIPVNSGLNNFFEFRVNMNNRPDTFFKVSYQFIVTQDANGNGVIRLTYRLTSGNGEIEETQPYQEEEKDFSWTSERGIGLPGATPPTPVESDPNNCDDDPDTPCDVYSAGPITISDKSEVTVNNLYTAGPLTMDNATTLIATGDFYVSGLATLSNHSVIEVQNGSAYFNDIDSKPNSTTVVIGDAYFYGNDTGKLVGSGNSALMCIQGTAHIREGINIEIEDINILPAGMGCKNTDGLSAGIWALGAVTFTGDFPAPPEWTSPQPGEGGEIELDPSYN
ncbi:hypothetical protein GCM10009865_35440 [Aeromicrobium ponti]|uniref:Uncharacterized protein n=1 Tax=Cytobacillus oceanisediminis TaxID=665099 RepID=A0A562JP53_9BACI|nr:hypothetical protein [Cytobacillus oceanisediminis]TWH84813.1 hypothetical protein IQ19_03397 [Cytobacillus oceanisediminis]